MDLNESDEGVFTNVPQQRQENENFVIEDMEGGDAALSPTSPSSATTSTTEQVERVNPFETALQINQAMEIPPVVANNDM